MEISYYSHTPPKQKSFHVISLKHCLNTQNTNVSYLKTNNYVIQCVTVCTTIGLPYIFSNQMHLNKINKNKTDARKKWMRQN